MRISDWSSDVCSSDLQRAHLGLLLDHLRDRAYAQAAAHPDDRTDDDGIPAIAQHPADVAAVDLHIVDVERLKICERGRARAEIVETHLVAKTAEGADCAAFLGQIGRAHV